MKEKEPIKIKVVYYIPEKLKDSKNVIETLDLLKHVKTPKSIKFEYETKMMDTEDEERLKDNILLTLSVKYGIKIKQTQKTKSLYPQLVVYWNDNLWRFYPENRAGEKEYTIKDFLNGLSMGKFIGYNIITR